MRFGLSDLDELPSLKEFEQLAQAALGSDEGIAPIEPDDAAASEGAGDFTASADSNADARESAVEAESSDASGEQSAESEFSATPAEAAAEAFADAETPSSESQAKGTSA